MLGPMGSPLGRKSRMGAALPVRDVQANHVEKWVSRLELADGRPFKLRVDQRRLLRGILREGVTTGVTGTPVSARSPLGGT